MNRKVQIWIAKGMPSEEKQILLFKVISKRGSGWHPITGGVEKGEDLFEAAIRETTEETGLDSSRPDAQWFNLNYSFSFEGVQTWKKDAPKYRAEEHAFGLWFKTSTRNSLGASSLRVELDPTEHTEAKWVSVKEALALLAFPNQKEALKLFYEQLGAKKTTA